MTLVSESAALDAFEIAVWNQELCLTYDFQKAKSIVSFSADFLEIGKVGTMTMIMLREEFQIEM